LALSERGDLVGARKRERGTGRGNRGAHVGRVLVLVVLVLVFGACGPAGGGDQAETVTVIKTVPADEGSGRAKEEGPELALGETFTTSGAGNEVTVLSYESPLTPAGSSRPDPGFEFSAVEVEGCASRDPDNYRMMVGPASFSLQMPDGARVQPETGGDVARVTERALVTMEPVLGGCESGFVVFQTPEGERPEIVLFEDQFTTTDSMSAGWTIPDE
jgi:hypothetical protein